MNKTIKTRKDKGKKKIDDNKKNKNTGRAKYSKSCLTNKLPNMTYDQQTPKHDIPITKKGLSKRGK